MVNGKGGRPGRASTLLRSSAWWAFALRRLGWSLATGERATHAQVEALRHQLGFDRPLLTQLGDYYYRLVQGDLGKSLFTSRPIAADLSSRLPATIELTLAAMALTIGLGVPIGVLSA